jgi:uncharacterized membrane protein YhdT
MESVNNAIEKSEPKKMTEKEKYKQCDKEAIITLVVTTIYALWWYFTGFGLNSLGVDALPWVMGLPMWFFLSCIIGWVGISIIIFFVIKFFFKNMDLGEEV